MLLANGYLSYLYLYLLQQESAGVFKENIIGEKREGRRKPGSRMASYAS
jgi:hypothetical protein